MDGEFYSRFDNRRKYTATGYDDIYSYDRHIIRSYDDYYWTLSRDGNGTHFADEGEVPADRPLAIKDGDSVTLYAQWARKITFHSNNGSDTTAIQTIPVLILIIFCRRCMLQPL